MTNLKGKHFALCGLFLALLAISSKIQIPTPLVPFTLQTATLLLCLLLLPNFLPFFTVGIYLFSGILGLPVFAQGGGFNYLLNPTFGYLLGFLACAFIKGLFYKIQTSYKSGALFCALCILIIHAIGALYAFLIYNLHLSANLSPFYSFIFSSAIFIPSDLAWCALCPLLSNKISKAIKL